MNRPCKESSRVPKAALQQGPWRAVAQLLGLSMAAWDPLGLLLLLLVLLKDRLTRREAVRREGSLA